MFRRKWDAKSIINHIMSRNGRKPLNAYYYATAYPAVYAAAERIFGSWGNAITDCGLDYGRICKYRKWSAKTVLKEISAAQKAKQSLSSNYIQKNNKPLYMAAVKRFRNWGSAVKAAGIDYGKIRLRRKMSRKEIKAEILELHRRGVDLAYPNMRKKYLCLLALGMNHLGDGSWVKARRKCGIHENYRLYVQRRR
ncbi:MAG: hypothetical protein WAX69_20270 [Victivallales bacterium]